MKILKKQNFFCFTFLHARTHQVSVTLSHLGRAALFTLFFLPCTHTTQCGRKIKENIPNYEKNTSKFAHNNATTTLQQWEIRNKSKTDCNNSTCSQHTAQE